MPFQSLGEPLIEPHFFPSFCTDEIWLSAQQTFRCGKADEIFRRLDLIPKMLVLRLDVGGGFCARVRLAISDERRIRVRHVGDQIANRLLERLRRLRLQTKQECSDQGRA